MTNPRQATRIPDSGPLKAHVLKRAQMCAEHCGVSVEHFVDIVRKRRIYRLNKFYRRRSRQRVKERNNAAGYESGRPRSGNRRAPGFGGRVTYTGEGPLESLMREVGMKKIDFLEMAGIGYTAFHNWYGHPMYKWPVELVTHVVWAQRMAEKLRSMGVDPEPLKPRAPTQKPIQGQYPRTTAQGAKFHLDPQEKR